VMMNAEGPRSPCQKSHDGLLSPYEPTTYTNFA
jgi:hypothetical protein